MLVKISNALKTTHSNFLTQRQPANSLTYTFCKQGGGVKRKVARVKGQCASNEVFERGKAVSKLMQFAWCEGDGYSLPSACSVCGWCGIWRASDLRQCVFNHLSHRNHFSTSVGLLPSPLMEIRFYWRDTVRFQHHTVSVSVKSCL